MQKIARTAIGIIIESPASSALPAFSVLGLPKNIMPKTFVKQSNAIPPINARNDIDSIIIAERIKAFELMPFNIPI